MQPLVLVVVLGFVSCGYIPPEYEYHPTSTCACDDERFSDLADKVSKLELDLDAQRARSDAVEKRIDYAERRKRQLGVEFSNPVAFTAYLSHFQLEMNIGEPVMFDQTLTNVGNAYDPATGKFVAPIDGLYIFSFIIETKHAVDTAARLVVDGVNMLDAVVEPRHQEQNLQGGNVGVLKVKKGQAVWVEIYNSYHQSLEGADTYRFTTFTGALLAPFSEETVATVEPVITG